MIKDENWLNFNKASYACHEECQEISKEAFGICDYRHSSGFERSVCVCMVADV